MLHFECDYNNGCCEEVLRRLTETNSAFETGYGFDSLSESARNKIREACGCPDADVFLLVGGTQTNATVITAVLRQYEGVVAAESGHINGHEAGAVEAGGHKILSLPQTDGKLDSGVLRAFLETYHADENKEHMVYPGMVYISFPTELGTIYSKAELEALRTELTDKGAADLQKAQEQINALTGELNGMKEKEAVRLMREKVAGEKKVPAHLLTGATEEACAKQADEILAFAQPGYPQLPDGGEPSKLPKSGTRDKFADWAKENL